MPPASRCLSKTHFFFSGRKRMVFEIQRKRGLMALLKRWQKRYGGVRLYAHGVDRPRPLRPAPVEQGKAVVLSLSRLVCGPCAAGCRAGLDGPPFLAPGNGTGCGSVGQLSAVPLKRHLFRDILLQLLDGDPHLLPVKIHFHRGPGRGTSHPRRK